jgi:hypothetical protein
MRSCLWHRFRGPCSFWNYYPVLRDSPIFESRAYRVSSTLPASPRVSQACQIFVHWLFPASRIFPLSRRASKENRSAKRENRANPVNRNADPFEGLWTSYFPQHLRRRRI